MSPREQLYHVHGTVTDGGGREVSGARVVVWQQRIRERLRLATGRTSEEGRYRLSYRQPDDIRGQLLLVVEARSRRLKEPLESTLTPAQPDLQIDLAVQPRDRSEYASLLGAIKPLLDDLELIDVVETDEHNDISFLAQELRKNTEQIMRVVVAARLEAAYAMPAAVFYAFLRQGVPGALPTPLLSASQGFSLIDALVRRIASLVFGLSPDVQTRTLTAAVAKELIGPQFGAQIAQIVSQLQTQHTNDLLGQPYLVGKATLGQLLDLVQLPHAKQQTFAQVLRVNTQTMRNFWRTLGDGQHGFTATEASRIERTLSIGAFVKNHLPLVKMLMQGFTAGTYKQLSDLARLSQKDWIQLVDQTGPPPSIDAAGAASPAEVFARVVYTRVTRAFPTVALASRVAAGSFIPQTERAPLNQFFLSNAGLDLIRNNLAIYLDQQGPQAFAGIATEDQAQVVANTKKLQRVLLVTPNIDTAQTLLGLGIHSATQVAMLGRQQFFLTATKAGLSKREANQIYETGAQRYARLVALYTQFNRDAIGLWPKALGQISDLDQPIGDAIQRDQSLATLFGSQDYCAVDGCTSILSPAAYLCDLLHWLGERKTGMQSALDVLDGRRPDIINLKLNCPNTETRLPYIDLVNEILADAISPPNDPNSIINPQWKQTSLGKTEADLRAAPEYLNQDAYAALFGASYPHTLPYSEGLDELRAYLQQSDLPLWQVRQALLPLHAPTTAQQVAVAAERFRMTPHEVDLITNANFVGLAVAWNTPNPVVDFAKAPPGIPAFLQAASISYDQLLELLEVVWVRGGGVPTVLQGVSDTCDTSEQTVAPLDAARLDLMHRFLRLWRRTGYAMWEVDMLLRAAAVANGTLDAAGLIAIGTFQLLQDTTSLAVDEQLAFFQNMDTASHRNPDGSPTTSLYARAYLNPAVISQHPDGDLAAVPTGGAINDSTLSNHLDAIQAALGISGTDASALATLFGLTSPNTLTLGNLSLLYRVSQLATAARLSLSDLQSVATLVNPGVPTAAAVTSLFASPSATLVFLQQVKIVQQSGFSIDALVYLLTPPPWTTKAGITDTGITTVLAAVRQAILNPSGGDVNGSATAAVAAQLGLANDVTAFLVQPPQMPQLQVPGTNQPLITVLTDPSLTSPQGGPYPQINRANYSNQFLAIELLDKVGVAIKRLHLVLTDLSWLLTNATVYGGLDFTTLPVVNTQQPLGLGPLLQTVLLVQLARLFNAAPPQSQIQTLYDLIGGVHSGTIVDQASAQAALATITPWPLADITALTTAVGASFPSDYTQPAMYDALRTLEEMIKALAGKASGSQLASWGAVPQDEKTAENMAASALNVLKARYSNADWLTVAPSIIDPIREHRSAALQDYLIGNGDSAGHVFGDVNGLFDWFLIDTQMSSCEVTTRVVQAYIAVQIFVERCRMNLEAPGVQIDPLDEAWGWWSWLKRFRIRQAALEVFLYPENLLIESQRPNRTEIFQKLEHEVHQNTHTADYLETVVLNYIDRLENISHLTVTGTCQDLATNAIHVVARTTADPPRYYHRSLIDGAWGGWVQIPLDIKAHQVVPAIYRGLQCLFWAEIKASNEPHQDLGGTSQSSDPPNQEIAKYVSVSIYFTIFRNGAWVPAQKARGKLFDIPILTSETVSDSRSVEELYTLKVQTQAPAPGYGASLSIDVFRLNTISFGRFGDNSDDSGPHAVHIGRAVFDGRFTDLELNDLKVLLNGTVITLLPHAQAAYGSDAQALVPLEGPADPDLVGDPPLVPRAGALMTEPPTSASQKVIPLTFTSTNTQQQDVGTLLNQARSPFRIIGAATNLNFDPTSYFFYQDGARCYFVETQRYYGTGSMASPTPPSNPDSAPFEARYFFHRFYHPYAGLFWHQLAGGDFAMLYDQTLQLTPDQVDPMHRDVFSFQSWYQPVTPRVSWGEDNEILDFTRSAAYSVYNWETFVHIPFYFAQLLSQNRQYEDAQTTYHYLFDPTRQSTDPAPKRFWIPQPLYNLTSSEILKERINNLLQLVNQGDPAALDQVARWKRDPFNPFLLADLRPVTYMKAIVMAYLDNLNAWADDLFASDSREALSEATLLYVVAAEILGPKPTAVTPPQHADESYKELAPKLDAFSNAMVDIENVMGPGGGGGQGSGNQLPGPQTFYFKIPPNDRLLGYWKKVSDQLFKLRHCQNIHGVERQLALFDAPIDPALLVKAQAGGVDIASVLTDVQVALLPPYRYTALYPQALDFVNAVRAYGALLLSALEKGDADQLAVMLATNQQELLGDADEIFGWQAEQAQNTIDALNDNLALANQKLTYYTQASAGYINSAESSGLILQSTGLFINSGVALVNGIAALAHLFPMADVGVSGAFSTPVAKVKEGGKNAGDSSNSGAMALKAIGDALDKGGQLANTVGKYAHNKDDWDEKIAETKLDITHTNTQIAGAELAKQIAQQNQLNHQTQVDQLQQQIEYLTTKATNQDLYDWMVGRLADTYFQSYRLAYKLCKQVERCYQYELDIPDSTFIQFGYWDSLHKGLLAGEVLNHDLRRLQASYLEQNVRRFEISRYISLAALDSNAFRQLLQTGVCDFDLAESLFDHDFQGHYHRQLVRLSATVVYPNAGKFDNVKATLTLVKNKVRVSNDPSPSYSENPVGSDRRFVYNYAAVPQKIALSLGNTQDDPGLFLTAINNNLSDQRYLPFEGGGAISSWHLEMLAASNEIALAKVTDVVLHLYYTALDGGNNLKQAVLNNA